MGNPKNLAFWAILILLLVTLFSVFQDGTSTGSGTQLSFSEFLDRVDNKEVDAVVIDGENITGHLTSGGRFTTVQPGDIDIIGDLRAAGIEISVEPQERGGLI